jgi:Bacterial regulatory proteins, gntR family
VAAGYRTKREIAVALLREAIIRGDLPPGTRLVLEVLSQRYHPSLTPIRGALPVLEAEGLIVHLPHRGAGRLAAGGRGRLPSSAPGARARWSAARCARRGPSPRPD